jgi:hypothetical protein
MDARLQRRYWQLVQVHMNSPQQVAPGPRALPGISQSFATTQALWRFLANPNVTLPQLVVPLRALGCQGAQQSSSPYALLVHDWSKLSYQGHASKADQTQLSHEDDVGYEMYTALLVDAAQGNPLAPMELNLLSARGVDTTRRQTRLKRMHHLEQILPSMRAARTWKVPRQIVHVIDSEADSQIDFRSWMAEKELFLVRGDFTRHVNWEGESFPLPKLAQTWQDRELFREAGTVSIRGATGIRQIAGAEIVLTNPGRKRTETARIKVSGPLKLRLVISRIVDADSQVMAEWYLLTNVGDDVSDATIADWYYWRWRIESYHKLLKSGGQQLESWQQESALAIAKRLLIASMVCVSAWQLQAQETPESKECQQFLVKLSGRQMKRSRPITTSALIAGLHLLIPMLELLEHHSPNELRKLAKLALPQLHRSG